MKSRAKLLVAIVVVWSVLEISAYGILQTALPSPAEMKNKPLDDKDWIVQTQMSFSGGLYIWDQYCFWRLAANYRGRDDEHGRRFWGNEILRTNAHGMRSPAVEKEKGAGVKRVLVLGGSHPMGMYVRLQQTYASELQRALNVGKTSWEVLNASVPGYTTFQGLQYLKHYAAQFSPDIVIFDLGVNDKLPLTTEYSLPDHEITQPPAWVSRVQNILRVSAVYRLLRHWIIAPKSNVTGIRVPDVEHRRNLSEVAELGKSQGYSVLYMSQARIDLYGSGKLQCQYSEADFEPRVDVCALWERLGSEARTFFADPIHANASGHALIAAEILRTMERLKWWSSR